MYTKSMRSIEVLPCTPTFSSYTMLRSIEVLPHTPAAHACTEVLPYTPRNLNKNNCHVVQKCFLVLPQLIRGTKVLPYTPRNLHTNRPIQKYFPLSG